MSHLRALEKKGVIQRHPNKARAVVFPEDLERGEIVDIPLYAASLRVMAKCSNRRRMVPSRSMRPRSVSAVMPVALPEGAW